MHLSAFAVLGCAAAVVAQPICPRVEPMRFGFGLDRPAEFAAEFDEDGAGPDPATLFLSGGFTVVAGQPAAGLARWDGDILAPVHGGPGGPKGAMASVRSGGENGLYVAGDGVLHCLQGGAWTEMPLPTFDTLNGTAISFAVFDPDDAGPRPEGLFSLVRYAGLAGENNAVLWRYDHQGWYRLSGPVPQGHILGFDADGTGPGHTELFHHFNVNRTNPVRTVGHLRKLHQDHWELIAHTGGNPDDTGIKDAAVFSRVVSGTSRHFLGIAGGFGAFRDQQGVWRYTASAALWDGSGWMTNGQAGSAWFRMTAAAARTTASGGALALATEPIRSSNVSVFEWRPPAWGYYESVHCVGTGAGAVTLLRDFDPDGFGPRRSQLVVSGEFHHAGDVQVERFAVFHKEPLLPPVLGGFRTPGHVASFQVFNDGTGRRLFAGGYQYPSGWGPYPWFSGVSRWDGSAWESLGLPYSGWVFSLAPHNDGAGWQLYAGGRFDETYGNPRARVMARWDGAQWSSAEEFIFQGDGAAPTVMAMAAFDSDGSGPLPPRLYVGGTFVRADELAARGLARWDGPHHGWAAVAGFESGHVHGLKVLDDGTGATLFVCGRGLKVAGSPETTVLRLRPGCWESVPPLMHSGPGTYVAKVTDVGLDQTSEETFLAAILRLEQGSTVSRRLFRLVKGEWQLVGYVDADSMRNIEDDEGRSLYIGKQRLTDSGFEPLAPAPDGGVSVVSPVFDDGHGPSVFIAGSFKTIGVGSEMRGAARVARVRICGSAEPCYANCDGSAAAPVLNIADFTCFLQRFAAGDPWANCDQSTAAPVLNIADFTCFLQRFAAGCE